MTPTITLDCPRCKKSVSSDANFCPECGLPFSTPAQAVKTVQIKPKQSTYAVITRGIRTVAAVLFGCTAIIGLIQYLSSNPSSISSVLTPQPRAMTYSVQGTQRTASLTYTNAEGGTAQENVTLPWSKEFSAQPGFFAALSAQNSDDHGVITVSISVDGNTLKTTTSQGEYVIASADGTVP